MGRQARPSSLARRLTHHEMLVQLVAATGQVRMAYLQFGTGLEGLELFLEIRGKMPNV
jgi:hypothetical protein